MKGLDFKVDQKIFNNLLEFRDNLPREATGGRKDGAMETYEHPAGLALLGENEGLVDTVIPLKMSGGCWDAPNINYKDMDTGFRALLKTGRRCVGMAFIRNPRWGSHYDQPQYEAKISQNLKLEIHKIRSSFEDITRTLWIVLHKNNFRFYKPHFGEGRRICVAEITSGNKIESNGEALHPIIVEKIEKVKKEKARKAALRKEKAEAEKKWKAANKKKLEQEAELRISIEKDFKERTKSIIPIGNGLSYVLNGKGEYIILQTGT
jgi:hypothetical protein